MKGQYEEKIDALLAQMTLEEKVGQLQQCGPSLVGAFEVSFEELLDMMFDGRISQEEFGRLMSTATQDYHEDDLRAGRIGSYNGVGDAATANRLQKIAVEESRLGIPLIFGYDVIHGFRTVTPIPLAEASDDGIRATVKLTNTGDRAGDEIVQCYIQDVVAKRVRPVTELKAFDKISLNPGETKTVTFEIPKKDFGYYDAQMNFCVDGGLYRVKVGTNSAEYLQAEVML